MLKFTVGSTFSGGDLGYFNMTEKNQCPIEISTLDEGLICLAL